jgi:hypothetical protein
LAEVEVVDFPEDYGDGFEPDVDKVIEERDIEIEEEDHRLREVENKRSDQKRR